MENFVLARAACPKDDFPLPHIDLFVDNTDGYEMFSFMDAFSESKGRAKRRREGKIGFQSYLYSPFLCN